MKVVFEKNMTDVEAKFKAALDVIQSLPADGPYKPAPNMLLMFYAYYKQATVGPCNRPKPWSFDVINKAKWDAWNKLGNMSKETAMENYVTELKKVMDSTPRISDKEIIEVLPASDASAKFVQTLGNFYEIVDSDKKDEVIKLKKLIDTGKSHSGDDTPEINGINHTSNDYNGDVLRQPDAPTNGNEVSADVYDPRVVDDEIKSESDEEFCDSSADVAILAKNDSTSQSEDSSLSNDSLAATPSKNTDSPRYEEKTPVEQLLDFQESGPLTYGGERGTHGADHGIPLSTQPETRGQDHGHTSQRIVLAQESQPVRHPGSSGSGHPHRRGNNRQDEVQERIAFILLQLQRDMHSVLNRLTTLETITMTKQQDTTLCNRCQLHGTPGHSSHSAPAWWPFPDVSPKTTLFFLLWPFIARILINVFRRKLRR